MRKKAQLLISARLTEILSTVDVEVTGKQLLSLDSLRKVLGLVRTPSECCSKPQTFCFVKAITASL